MRIVKQGVKRNEVAVGHIAFIQNITAVATRKPSVGLPAFTCKVHAYVRRYVDIKRHKIALTLQRRIIIYTLFRGEIYSIANRARQLEEGGCIPRIAYRDCRVIYHSCLHIAPATFRSTYRLYVGCAVPNYRRGILVTRQRRQRLGFFHFRLFFRFYNTEITDIQGEVGAIFSAPNVDKDGFGIFQQRIQRYNVAVRHFTFLQNITAITTRKPRIGKPRLTANIHVLYVRVNIKVKGNHIPLALQRFIIPSGFFRIEIQECALRLIQFKERGCTTLITCRNRRVIHYLGGHFICPMPVPFSDGFHFRCRVPQNGCDVLFTRQRQFTDFTAFVTAFIFIIVVNVRAHFTDFTAFVTIHVTSVVVNVRAYLTGRATFVTIHVTSVVVNVRAYLTGRATIVTIRVASIVIIMLAGHSRFPTNITLYVTRIVIFMRSRSFLTANVTIHVASVVIGMLRFSRCLARVTRVVAGIVIFVRMLLLYTRGRIVAYLRSVRAFTATRERSTANKQGHTCQKAQQCQYFFTFHNFPPKKVFAQFCAYTIFMITL